MPGAPNRHFGRWCWQCHRLVSMLAGRAPPYGATSERSLADCSAAAAASETVTLVHIQTLAGTDLSMQAGTHLRRIHRHDAADPLTDTHVVDRQTPDVSYLFRRHLVGRHERVHPHKEAELRAIHVADTRHDGLVE